ncbi:MAG: glutamine synthetase family protein [Chitinophagales bacterium]
MNKKQSYKEVLSLLLKKDTQKIKLAVTDIDGVLRGKLISFEKFRSVAEKGFGFCDVVFGWDSSDHAYDNAKFTGWHTGYPDTTALIDMNSFRRIPWENETPFFLADFGDEKGAGLEVCPRSLLKRISLQSEKLGYMAFFSQEFEWYNFIHGSEATESNQERQLLPLSKGMFGYSILRASQHSAYFNDLFDSLNGFGIPIEGMHTETGPGVYEAAIQYAGIPEAADRAVLFKSAVKEIAHRHGIVPSFMAKFSENLPGCSGHIHQSLWSGDGKQNLFFGKKNSAISPLMENYISGQLHCLPHILPMYAPTINSYKRLVEGAWAPTTLTWGIDNRTTALRVINGSASSTRLETRVVGSDANPYLAMAACLASGLYGIRHKLKLTTPRTIGNGYADKKNGLLPPNLKEATEAMRQSGIAKDLFGETFVEHFTGTREWEWRQFSKSVTDWEFKRYFEII